MVIMYADRITEGMRLTIEQTNRQREKQMIYNELNHITPQQIQSRLNSALGDRTSTAQYYVEPENKDIALDPVVKAMTPNELDKAIENTRNNMAAAAKKLEFIEAAQWRDELIRLEEIRNSNY
jgi:excinuclease ABC subunit B